MRRAFDVLPAGTWDPSWAAGSVTLPFDSRHRRRIRMVDDGGEAFLLDLAEAALLGDGDGLALAGGGTLAVKAAAEPVAEIRCSSSAHMARIAWHIGNRHTPVQVLDDGALRIRDDHVLVAMAEGLGGKVTQTQAGFAPEPGAYAIGHGHEHDY